MTLLRQAAHAHATGDTRHAEDLYAQALTQHTAAIRRGIRRATTNPNHFDEAENDTRLRLWRLVERDAFPTGSEDVEEGLVVQLAYWTGIGVLRKHVRHEAVSLDELTELGFVQPAADVGEWDKPPPPVPLVAEDAPRVWHDIITLAEHAWTQREIALKLALPPPTVRRIVVNIRTDYERRLAA